MKADETEGFVGRNSHHSKALAKAVHFTEARTRPNARRNPAAGSRGSFLVVVFGLSIDAVHQPFRWRFFWLPSRHFLVVYYSFDNMVGEATIHLSVVDSFVVVSFLV